MADKVLEEALADRIAARAASKFRRTYPPSGKEQDWGISLDALPLNPTLPGPFLTEKEADETVALLRNLVKRAVLEALSYQPVSAPTGGIVLAAVEAERAIRDLAYLRGVIDTMASRSPKKRPPERVGAIFGALSHLLKDRTESPKVRAEVKTPPERSVPDDSVSLPVEFTGTFHWTIADGAGRVVNCGSEPPDPSPGPSDQKAGVGTPKAPLPTKVEEPKKVPVVAPPDPLEKATRKLEAEVEAAILGKGPAPGGSAAPVVPPPTVLWKACEVCGGSGNGSMTSSGDYLEKPTFAKCKSCDGKGTVRLHAGETGKVGYYPVSPPPVTPEFVIPPNLPARLQRLEEIAAESQPRLLRLRGEVDFLNKIIAHPLYAGPGWAEHSRPPFISGGFASWVETGKTPDVPRTTVVGVKSDPPATTGGK